MSDPHLVALRQRLDAIMPMLGGSVIQVSPYAASGTASTQMMMRRLMGTRMPAHHDPVTVRFNGWGVGLEAAEIRRNIGIDRSLPVEDTADQALESLNEALANQLALRAEAARCGIEAPLSGYGLEMLDHLVVDADLVPALVPMLGSLKAVRTYFAEQMALRREEVESGNQFIDALCVHVEGRILHVPIDLKRGQPIRPNGDETTMWDDDALVVKAVMPESMLIAAVGRLVGDVVQGTPLGHRTISEASGQHAPFGQEADGIRFGIHTPRVALEEAIA